jgi:predicted transposase/invertase (TIGR01784 family)
MKGHKMPKDKLESAVTKLDSMQELDADAVKKDAEFKTLFKYKSVAAMLLKYAVPDFEKYTLQEIADSILDIRPRSPASDAERYHTAIDLLNEESGDAGEKLIRMDIVFAMQFTMKLPGSEKMTYVNVTIDFEMQKNKPTEYKIVKRGIYYAASLLRDTLTSAEKYANIHKVYSVWLCNFELLEGGRYVHKYNMFRNYSEEGRQICEKDADADLLEVVFVELTKLAEHMQDELAQFLNTVFHDIGGLPELMEKKLGVAIGGTALEKGVSEVIDMAKYGEIMYAQGNADKSKYGEIREAQGEFKGERKKAIETAINLIKMGILTLKQIAQSTGLTEEDVIEAKHTIDKK